MYSIDPSTFFDVMSAVAGQPWEDLGVVTGGVAAAYLWFKRHHGKGHLAPSADTQSNCDDIKDKLQDGKVKQEPEEDIIQDEEDHSVKEEEEEACTSDLQVLRQHHVALLTEEELRGLRVEDVLA